MKLNFSLLERGAREKELLINKGSGMKTIKPDDPKKGRKSEIMILSQKERMGERERENEEQKMKTRKRENNKDFLDKKL